MTCYSIPSYGALALLQILESIDKFNSFLYKWACSVFLWLFSFWMDRKYFHWTRLLYNTTLNVRNMIYLIVFDKVAYCLFFFSWKIVKKCRTYVGCYERHRTATVVNEEQCQYWSLVGRPTLVWYGFRTAPVWSSSAS